MATSKDEDRDAIGIKASGRTSAAMTASGCPS
jgi:hypothetical protein